MLVCVASVELSEDAVADTLPATKNIMDLLELHNGAAKISAMAWS